nr:MAG TPA: hypothetical protein [Caudoviricetes sp.]
MLVINYQTALFSFPAFRRQKRIKRRLPLSQVF